MVPIVWVGGFGGALDPLLQRRYPCALENYQLRQRAQDIPLSTTGGRRRF
jgi:hypothetical protein